MMKKKNGQRGAFLVLAAVIIPFIFICAGFAADFGKAWAVRAKLQNALELNFKMQQMLPSWLGLISILVMIRAM